jgi:hypothetical protein
MLTKTGLNLLVQQIIHKHNRESFIYFSEFSFDMEYN